MFYKSDYILGYQNLHHRLCACHRVCENVNSSSIPSNLCSEPKTEALLILCNSFHNVELHFILFLRFCDRL